MTCSECSLYTGILGSFRIMEKGVKEDKFEDD
jgi:hypothetical protein